MEQTFLGRIDRIEKGDKKKKKKKRKWHSCFRFFFFFFAFLTKTLLKIGPPLEENNLSYYVYAGTFYNMHCSLRKEKVKRKMGDLLSLLWETSCLLFTSLNLLFRNLDGFFSSLFQLTLDITMSKFTPNSG